MSVLFSLMRIAVALHHRADGPAQIAACLRAPSCAAALVRMLVAAACMQTLAACAGRPVQPESAAAGFAGVRMRDPPPRRTHLEASPEAGCVPQMVGLGDTWPEADAAAARVPHEHSCHHVQKSSCAAECVERNAPTLIGSKAVK